MVVGMARSVCRLDDASSSQLLAGPGLRLSRTRAWTSPSLLARMAPVGPR